MAGFTGVNLKELLDNNPDGEHWIKPILSSFICPLNPDVENFIRHKAIEFTKQGLSTTHLVLASYKDENVLVGYYSLANKFIAINKDSVKSNSKRRRIAKFATYDNDMKRYQLSAPLIGQLGKNYANSYNNLISGDELLKLALDQVKKHQLILGGRYVYLECEDKQKLISFYEKNGFENFGKRTLDGDEKDDLSGDYLIQMLKYLK